MWNCPRLWRLKWKWWLEKYLQLMAPRGEMKMCCSPNETHSTSTSFNGETDIFCRSCQKILKFPYVNMMKNYVPGSNIKGFLVFIVTFSVTFALLTYWLYFFHCSSQGSWSPAVTQRLRLSKSYIFNTFITSIFFYLLSSCWCSDVEN